MMAELAFGTDTVAANSPQPVRVLLVDDNDTCRKLLQSLLRRVGYAVDSARDGIEALEAASRAEYDVVVMDIQMPRLDGFAAARALRGLDRPGKPLRIIGISGESQERAYYAAAGMDAFLDKPVLLRELTPLLNAPSPQ